MGPDVELQRLWRCCNEEERYTLARNHAWNSAIKGRKAAHKDKRPSGTSSCLYAPLRQSFALNEELIRKQEKRGAKKEGREGGKQLCPELEGLIETIPKREVPTCVRTSAGSSDQ